MRAVAPLEVDVVIHTHCPECRCLIVKQIRCDYPETPLGEIVEQAMPLLSEEIQKHVASHQN